MLNTGKKGKKHFMDLNLKTEKQKAILICVDCNQTDIDASANETVLLADSAGAYVEQIFSQKREKPDPIFYIGKGKAEEIAHYIKDNDIELCITNDDLSGVQQKNLEDILDCTIIDRTVLILDIFAARATSNEGKIQVELAQLKYNLPRLTGKGKQLSRLGGGIGTRGPGEKKLETDKRRIRREIKSLEEKLAVLEKNRNVQKKRRREGNLPLVSIVGYTNAGKSTLLNALTKANVLAEDKLFATLDPVTRRIWDNGREYLLSDTVGFVDRLPHTLVEAFKSTLKEVEDADLLLLVLDASDEKIFQQYEAVLKVLEEIKSDKKPIIFVYNKCDKIENAEEVFVPGAKINIKISALKGEGLQKLKEEINNVLYNLKQIKN